MKAFHNSMIWDFSCGVTLFCVHLSMQNIVPLVWKVSNQFLWDMTAPVLWKPLERKCFKATLLKRHLWQAWFPWKYETYILCEVDMWMCVQNIPTVQLETQKLNMFSLQVLKVPWPSNSSYSQLTPSHVVVRRCSGGCHGGLTSCVPTKTDKRKVSVLLARWVWPVVHLVLALDQLRCPLGGGSCQKECATLEVEDELACGCGCRLDPSSCRS